MPTHMFMRTSMHMSMRQADHDAWEFGARMLRDVCGAAVEGGEMRQIASVPLRQVWGQTLRAGWANRLGRDFGG